MIFSEMNYCIYTILAAGLAWHDHIAVELLSPTVILQKGEYVHHMQQTTIYILAGAKTSWTKNHLPRNH